MGSINKKKKEKRKALTSLWGLLVHGSPSTIICAGSSNVSGPTRALMESALLAWSPLEDTEHVVILLSVDEGEAIRLGRDRERRCRPRSLPLFLCCGTLARLGLAAVELREYLLRTDMTVLGDTVLSAIDSASSEGVVGKP